MHITHRTSALLFASTFALLLTPLALAQEPRVLYDESSYYSPGFTPKSSSSSSTSSMSTSSSSSIPRSSSSSSSTLSMSVFEDRLDNCMRQALTRGRNIVLNRIPRILVDRLKLRSCILEMIWSTYGSSFAPPSFGGMSMSSNSSSTNTNSVNVSGSTSSGVSVRDQFLLSRDIVIDNMAYSPRFTQVKRGATVTWKNNDSVDHTVTSDTGAGPMSVTISPGGSYTYTFMNTGTYSYHCDVHPSMRGTVQVIK